MVKFQKMKSRRTILCAVSKSPCTMHYQPIIDGRTKHAVAFEAFFRGFKGGSEGNSGEALFASSAAKEDLWEFDIACFASALRHGRDLARNHLLFINIHEATIRRLAENIYVILLFMKAIGIDPGSIVLEIAEESAISDVAYLGEDIRMLKALGFRIAFDRVTSTSNWIECLPELSPAFLKLAPANVTDIAHRKEGRSFVDRICRLSEERGMNLIAVGVETEEGEKTLKDLGVPFMQGYLFGHPQHAAAWRVPALGEVSS